MGSLSLYCGDAYLGEELAQEALTRVVRDWKRVQKMDVPEAWLHRVAFNLANSFFRRRAAEARAKDRMAIEEESTREDRSADDIAVREAVASLPRRQRTALILRYFVGMSVRQTAEAMGCPEGTVKTLSHKAIGQLRDQPHIQELREA